MLKMNVNFIISGNSNSYNEYLSTKISEFLMVLPFYIFLFSIVET